MDRKIGLGVALGVALGIAAPALAQQAVQWRVEDGGNGHWYMRESSVLIWTVARQYSQALGGDLACFETVAEWNWASNRLGTTYALVGARQDPGSLNASDGWRWISGPSVTIFELWMDDNPCGGSPSGVEDGQQDYGEMVVGGTLGDINSGPEINCGDDGSRQFLIEWSADCNGDGAVDYGQILDGTFSDGNTNGIPDCCDQGVECVSSLIKNGSFELGPVQSCGWICLPAGTQQLTDWQVLTASIDRQLTLPTCPPDGSWVPSHGSHAIDLDGCSTGGSLRQVIATSPGSTYRLSLKLTGNCPLWPDKRIRITCGSASAEFGYTCQGSGIQPWTDAILDFTATSPKTPVTIASLSPMGINGPVIDEVRVLKLSPPCTADIVENGVVDGIDLAAVLGAWGTTGGSFDADVNDDGTVDAGDLSIVLAGWGPCPN